MSAQYAKKRIKDLLEIRACTGNEEKLKHAMLHQYYRIYKRNKKA